VRIIVRLGTSLTTPILALFVQSLAAPDARIASLTGLISGFAAATSATSSVILGRSGDRIGYRPVLLISTVAAAVLYVPQFFVTSPWQLLILQGAVGFALGGVVASISASQAKLAPEGHQGAVYGLDASATSAADAVGPMIGASMAAALGLRLPFLLTAGALGLAACLTWALIPADRKN